ncbi:MAG: MBL fold metallo-hydrolase, partial [Terriglobia bacterium]
ESKPRIISVPEVVAKLGEEHVPAEQFGAGKIIRTSHYSLEGTEMDHVVQGEKVDGFGVVIESGGKRVYHAADTMVLSNKPRADIVIVPINNRGVSMSIQEAAVFVVDLGARIAIPVHYDSPKDKHIDPQEFEHLLQGTAVQPKILGFGETLEV